MKIKKFGKYLLDNPLVFELFGILMIISFSILVKTILEIIT